jgi:hypothetical protein
VPRAVQASMGITARQTMKEELMDVYCGIDWAEGVRHEVAWCE